MVDFATTTMPTNDGSDVFSTVGRRKARKLFEALGWIFVLLLIFCGSEFFVFACWFYG